MSLINFTLYEMVYGHLALVHIPYLPGDLRVDVVDMSVQARETAINLLNFHLQKAMDMMKQQADKKRVI